MKKRCSFFEIGSTVGSIVACTAEVNLLLLSKHASEFHDATLLAQKQNFYSDAVWIGLAGCAILGVPRFLQAYKGR